MRIFYLYDQEAPDRDAARDAIVAWAERGGHELESASAEGLAPCLGCFGCWLRTPGRCVIPGDRWEAVFGSFVRANLVVMAGEIPYGSFSPAIKSALDRWLPALLPFFRRFRGEMHHVPRYRRVPRILSLALGPSSGDGLAEAEEATHLELARALCDDAACPRQRRFFRFRGDGAALAAWLDEEAAS